MIWRTIGRLILVSIAALMGALAALGVLATLGLERLTQATYGQSLSPKMLDTIFDAVTEALQLISGTTLLPALAVILIGEVARIRSWLFYVLGGGAALASIPLLTVIKGGVVAALPAAALWQVLATAGFAGGLIYWMIAGRGA